MTINKHDRLTYKKDTINLSKFLNNQLIFRLIDVKKITLVINKFKFIFSSNEFTYFNIRKRTSVKRSARFYVISFKQNNITRIELLICRKKKRF